MRIKVVEIGARSESAGALMTEVVALEQRASYPLGQDSFRIDHGEDYFAFFRRLGRLRYFVLLADGRVAAVAAAVLRRVPMDRGERAGEAWYLCDLKVHPDFRGRHLPLRLLTRTFLPCVLRCRRAYAVSMNPGDGRPNPVVRLLGRFRLAPLRPAGRLLLYSLEAGAVRRLRPQLETALGPVSFLSLRGRKDLILGSTGAPLPLLHLQHGPLAEAGQAEPEDGSTHMLCRPEGDGLIQVLAAAGIEPSADASLVSLGMTASDWRFILTSDI